MPIEPPFTFATLAIVYRQPEAASLVSMLRAYGIAARAPAWATATVASHWTVLIGGIVVEVPSCDLDIAIALVGDPRDLPAPQRNFRCGPLCNGLIAAALLVFMVNFGTIVVLPPRARGDYAWNPAAVFE